MSTYGALPPDADAWHFPARHRRVVDGDTIDLRCDMGFRTVRDVRVRLYGVDTAEIYGSTKGSDEYERGKTHQEFVEAWVVAALANYNGDWPLRVYTLKDRGKYGRYLADLVRRSDGQSLVAALHDEFDDVAAE